MMRSCAGNEASGALERTGRQRVDSIVTMRRFTSPGDFLSRLITVFRGPSFISTLRKTDGLFREKILLAVTLANNCYT